MTSSQASTGKSRRLHLDLDREIKNLSYKDLSNPDQDSKSIQSQYSSMDLHSSMRSSSQLHYKTSTVLDDLMKSVNKTEKQINSMEKSIKKTRKVKIDLNSPQLLGDLQAQLIQERQNNYAMQKENERLRRKVHYKKNYQHDLNCLQEDYHNLVESFMKSEEIRKKQKTLIRNLKSSIMN